MLHHRERDPFKLREGLPKGQALTPAAPAAGSVFAKMTKKSAALARVMPDFSPLRKYRSPFRTAFACSATASVPQWGSVTAWASVFCSGENPKSIPPTTSHAPSRRIFWLKV